MSRLYWCPKELKKNTWYLEIISPGPGHQRAFWLSYHLADGANFLIRRDSITNVFTERGFKPLLLQIP